jgi:hypothetical protein
VRIHFGFKLDTREERFKEMLEQKEKEEKKKQKEAKRHVKEAKMIERLTTKNRGVEPENELSPDKIEK